MINYKLCIHRSRFQALHRADYLAVKRIYAKNAVYYNDLYMDWLSALLERCVKEARYYG